MHLWVWAEKRKWKNTRHINYAFLLLPPSQAICLTADQMTRNYTAQIICCCKSTAEVAQSLQNGGDDDDEKDHGRV